jgi:aminoglycoside phosphotransferase (APT) family kinase protein
VATKGLVMLAQLIYGTAQPDLSAPRVAQSPHPAPPPQAAREIAAGVPPDDGTMVRFLDEQRRRHEELGARVDAWLRAHPRRRRPRWWHGDADAGGLP